MLQKPNLDYKESNASSDYSNDNSILSHRIPNREQNSDYIESKEEESTAVESEIDCFEKMMNLRMKYPKKHHSILY